MCFPSTMLSAVSSNFSQSCPLFSNEASGEIEPLGVDQAMDRTFPILDDEDRAIFSAILMDNGLVAGSDVASPTSSLQRGPSTAVSVSSGDERDEQAVEQDADVTSTRRGTSRTKDRPRSRRNRGKHCATTSKGFKRHFTVHDYHDYSHVSPSEVDLEPRRNGVHVAFPIVLHRLMEDAEPNGFSHIISWCKHGRAFLIHDSSAFVECILPSYFKHSKLSSFQRQLSLYGFVRLTSDGEDRRAYYHECFLRYRPFLCNKIQRTKVKGTWVRTSSSPETEPNFHLMEPVRPLESLTKVSATSSALEDNKLPTGVRGSSPVETFLAPISPSSPSPAPLLPPPGLPKETTMKRTPMYVPSNPFEASLMGDSAPDMESILADIDLDIEFDADVIFPL